MSIAESFTQPHIADVISVRVNHLLFINRQNQRRLAVRLGLKPASVSAKMTGANRWNVDEVLALAQYFEVATDYLYGLEPIESAQPVKTEGPVSVETGPSASVAGAGFEPTTSGL